MVDCAALSKLTIKLL